MSADEDYLEAFVGHQFHSDIDGVGHDMEVMELMEIFGNLHGGCTAVKHEVIALFDEFGSFDADALFLSEVKHPFLGDGGIFVEVLKDVSSGLAPLSYGEAYSMIHSLRGYKIIKGTRGQKGLNEQKYAEIIVRLSTLLRFATEIKEMDINPLLADEHDVVAVDARIRIERS